MIMNAKMQIFWALKSAESQSTSLLHRDRPSGERYAGEADGLRFALRAIAVEQREGRASA